MYIYLIILPMLVTSLLFYKLLTNARLLMILFTLQAFYAIFAKAFFFYYIVTHMWHGCWDGFTFNYFNALCILFSSFDGAALTAALVLCFPLIVLAYLTRSQEQGRQ